VEDGDAVADLLDERQGVRGHQHRPPRAPELEDQRLELARAVRIQADQRLVADEDRRLVHQRRAERRLLLHPVAHALDGPVHVVAMRKRAAISWRCRSAAAGATP